MGTRDATASRMLGQLTPDQIEDVLRASYIGRIGCHAGGRTYVVPVTYAYDGAAVYMHSAEGLKLRMMRENPEVCFEVDAMTDLSTWRSVIAWGRFEELAGGAASHGMRMLIDRFRPLMTSETAAPREGHGHGGAAVLYKIVLGERTGRFERR